MKIGFMAIALGLLLAAAPAWSQGRSSRITASGQFRIPSDSELQREVFTNPRSNFSSIDAVADGEMERMDREIDRLVERGICDGC